MTWKCIKAYKVFGYRKGMKLSDEDIQRQFMWTTPLAKVKKMKKGTVRQINHPFAELVFQKI